MTWHALLNLRQLSRYDVVFTFMIVDRCVTVFMQQLLHTAQCDGGEVTGVLQLQESLQVGHRLTPSHVHALTVCSIQSWTEYFKIKEKKRHEMKKRLKVLPATPSPAVDDGQDVWAVVSWGQDDAGGRRLQVPLGVVMIEAVQAVHSVGDVRDAVALKEQLWHHLPTVQRVAGCLRYHEWVCNTALKKKRRKNVSLLLVVICSIAVYSCLLSQYCRYKLIQYTSK